VGGAAGSTRSPLDDNKVLLLFSLTPSSSVVFLSGVSCSTLNPRHDEQRLKLDMDPGTSEGAWEDEGEKEKEVSQARLGGGRQALASDGMLSYGIFLF
jgi:hypothetical protein